MAYTDKTQPGQEGQAKASSAADKISSDPVGAAKDAASDAADKARGIAEQVTQTVTSGAANYARDAKASAADEVRGVSSALRLAAEDLRRGSPAERTFSQLADGLADVSDTIRGKDLGEIVNDVNAFARRNPITFLGGAALLGFAATRFVRASGETGSEMARPVPATSAPVPATPAPARVTTAAPGSAQARAGGAYAGTKV
ncbi:hypothetical protein AB1M95_04145 [Sulfitobacter sp. LCG007]